MPSMQPKTTTFTDFYPRANLKGFTFYFVVLVLVLLVVVVVVVDTLSEKTEKFSAKTEKFVANFSEF
jgi:hypothetical protein